MKLAISNIAWTAAEDDAVAEVMRERGVTAVEIAPSRVWPRPLEATDDEVRAHARYWAAKGIRVASLQALLFGQPDLTIFEDASRRAETERYLTGIIRLGSLLGATALVFGSPKNRLRGTLTMDQAMEIAVPFFRRLGDVAEAHGVALCIEPNPPEYGADFITDSVQSYELVARVGSAGFRLHLDAGAMHLAGEDVAARVRACLPLLRHVHLSEPYLAHVVESGQSDLAGLVATLARLGYGHWMSIEMRSEPGNNAARVDTTLQYVTALARGVEHRA